MKDSSTLVVVNFEGTIMPGKSTIPFGSNKFLNVDSISGPLEKAFSTRNVRAVGLRINCPGGSPVQSSLIAKHIQRQREKHPDIPVIAFVEDICASGGYYVRVDLRFLVE